MRCLLSPTFRSRWLSNSCHLEMHSIKQNPLRPIVTINTLPYQPFRRKIQHANGHSGLTNIVNDRYCRTYSSSAKHMFFDQSPLLDSKDADIGHKGRESTAVDNTEERIDRSERDNFERSRKAKVIFVLGGPGAGKGTQCEQLAKEFGVKHLSAGELLRQERLTGSEKGKLIESYLKEGKIVPVELSLSLLKREILESNEDRYLIDGFPRNYDNLNGWLKIMPSVCDIELVVFIECGEQELERRILQRGLTSNRSDDNLATVKKRFYTFQNDSLPVIQFFEQNQQDYPYIRLNGDQSIEQVYDQLKTAFINTIKQDLQTINQQLNKELLFNKGESEIFSGYCSNRFMGSILFGFELEQIGESGGTQILEDNIRILDGDSAEYSYTIKKKGQLFTIHRKWKCERGLWRIVEISCT